MAASNPSSRVTVDTPDSSFNQHQSDRRLVATLCSGTEAMRAAGERFLPRESGESSTEYSARLGRSILYPATEEAIEEVVSRIFRKPLVPGDCAADSDQEIFDDADLAGQNLNCLARDAFRRGVQDGIAYLHVEYPRVDAANAGEERAQNARPYFRIIDAEDVIGIESTTVGGVQTLSKVRIRETATIPDGDFGEKSIPQIRVLYPGRQEIWRAPEDGKAYQCVETIPISLPEIPLVALYVERCGFYRGRPPYKNLAWLNVAHWQSYSDQRNILRVGRVPILVGSGVSENDLPSDGKITIGSSRLLTFSNPDARLAFCEISGAAIAAGAEDLKQLEEKMHAVSVEILKRSGDLTATEASIQGAENTAWLQWLAASLEDALNVAYHYADRWRGGDGENAATVRVNRDFGQTSERWPLDALDKARARGDVSQRTYLSELQRRSVLPEDLDLEAELEATAEERAAATEPALPPAPPPPGAPGDKGKGPGDPAAAAEGEGDPGGGMDDAPGGMPMDGTGRSGSSDPGVPNDTLG